MSAPWFYIIVRARNAEKYICRCLHSVQKQTYAGWSADVYLDCPTDGTYDRILEDKHIDDDSRIDCTVNESRLGLSQNLWQAVSALRGSLDRRSAVVAILDGDDYLRYDALARVAQEYKERKCWITHGSYEKHSKGRKTKISQPYPAGANVMHYPWRASHLKTFRMRLLEHIRPEWFQDEKGNWLPAASDVALMLPLMQVAGLKHVRHIPDPIYVWRDDTPHRTDRELQRQCEAIVRRRWGR